MATIKKILITGASGYLARFIIERLQDTYQLTLTDIVAPENVPANTTFIKADVTNASDIEAVCAEQDAVVHLVTRRAEIGEYFEYFGVSARAECKTTIRGK